MAHPLLKGGVKLREYQESAVAVAIEKNTLVVLPTGLGKTIIALFVAAYRLGKVPQSKLLFLAPTKPLVQQHLGSFRKQLKLGKDEFALLTGEEPAKNRKDLWKRARAVFATPQTIENDLITGNIDLKDVSLVVFDEAHRAVGEYAYVFIAKKYREQGKSRLSLALTASPGNSKEKIKEIVDNLDIEDVEMKTDKDWDVRPYVESMAIDWVKVELPENFKRLRGLINGAIRDYLSYLKKKGYLPGKEARGLGKRDLLNLQAQLRKEMLAGDKVWGEISDTAALLKLQHGLELLETQGIAALDEYMKRLRSQKSKAVNILMKRSDIRSAIGLAQILHNQGVEHPKLGKLREMITDQIAAKRYSKIIVFTHYRDSVEKVLETLEGEKDIAARKLIGQAVKGKQKGMNQKQQKEILEEFNNSIFNVLVATSVGEEGLDIDEVDLVIFYEPIPSEIRTIQRRGRTARKKPGRLAVLMAKGTLDEVYHWSAFHKERRMRAAMKEIKREFGGKSAPGQSSLKSFVDQRETKRGDKVYVYVDQRERNSGIAKKLSEMGVSVDIKQLEVADFLVSEKVAVERKSLTSDTPIIIKSKKGIEIKSISSAYDLYKKDKNIQVMGTDFTKQRIGWFDVTDMTIHESEDVYGLRLHPKRDKKNSNEHTYSVKITGGHNIYVLRRGKILCLPTSKIKEGDYIIVTPPELANELRLPYESFENYLGKVQENSSKGFKLDFKKNKYKLNSAPSWYKIPNFNEDFFFVLGLWTAEGGLQRAGIKICQKTRSRNKIIEAYLKRVFGKFSFNGDAYCCGGKVYARLFIDIFGGKRNSGFKLIPQLVFSAPKELKAAFIRGYFFGDGWINKGEDRRNPQLKVVSKSRQLIVGMSYLLYSLRIENTVNSTYKEYEGERREYFELSVKTKSLKRFVTEVGQIPTKELKLRKTVSSRIPREAMDGFQKRFTALSESEVEELYESVLNLGHLYNHVGTFIRNLTDVSNRYPSKVEFCKKYGLNYSTIRNLRNGYSQHSDIFIQLVNIIREEQGLDRIDVNLKRLRVLLTRIKLHYKRVPNSKGDLSDVLIKDLLMNIGRNEGIRSLFILNSFYKGKLFLKRVRRIERIPGRHDVYDFSVDKAENFVGGLVPILLHNTTSDFLQSIVDGRLMSQMSEMCRNFETPLVIIEGDPHALYTERNIHPNAIRGAIASIAVNFGIPIMYTTDTEDTAAFIYVLAKREQEGKIKEIALRGEKRAMSLSEWQRFVVESLPNVSAVLAKRLLEHFKSVEKVFGSKSKELQEVEGIGSKKAKRIREIIKSKYE